MTFPEWLSNRSDEAGLSQSDLGRGIGLHLHSERISRQAVNRWFTGLSTPSIPSLNAIFDVLKIDNDGRAEAVRLISEDRIKPKMVERSEYWQGAT